MYYYNISLQIKFYLNIFIFKKYIITKINIYLLIIYIIIYF